MNLLLLSHEWLVLVLGLGLLLADLWTPAGAKRTLGYAAAAGLAIVLIFSFLSVNLADGSPRYAFENSYVLDPLAVFFKRFFIVAAILVLLMSVEFAPAIPTGISEYYVLVLFSLLGMMLAASANDLALLFVSLELVTVSFYVLTSFQRTRVASLEAGVKYLIIGALSTSFTVFGIAFVFGTSGRLNFQELAAVAPQMAGNPLFLFGLLCVLVGLGFKIAAFPFQIWAPDVYQGAPAPTTAFLAVGSKAAGFVLLLRVLFTAVPEVTVGWSELLLLISGITILYGNLAALPQRNIKRLLGYSSIAHAGYLLLGVAALSHAGQAAVLFYLAGYLFTVLAAFAAICVVLRHLDDEDVSALAGLHTRAPLLAGAMLLAMVSLAGIPPLVGFFGKFLLVKAALDQAPGQPAYYWAVAAAIVGVVISLYYYFNVVRVMYWATPAPAPAAFGISPVLRGALYVCMAAMLLLGFYPGPMVRSAERAAQPLALSSPVPAALSASANLAPGGH